MKKTIGNLTVRIGADTKQFSNAMRRTRKQTNTLSNQFKKLGGIMAGAFSIYAAGSVIKNAIRKNIEFEKAMADVKAITKATGSELAALEKDALKLGSTTEHTASAVASLQKEYGKLGFTTDEILAATGATLDLATATGEELARSAEVAGATIRGFGLDAQETRRVVDLMAASFTSSALDLDRFGESMKYVAPVAKVAGVSIEETTAMLAALADAGIHGSMAGTALKKILSKLVTPGKTMQQVFKELADKNIGLAEAEDLVGERGKAALLVLTGQISKLQDLTTEYNNAGGAAKDMADIQRNTVAGAIASVQSAWEGLILTMQSSAGWLMGFLNGVADVLKSIGGNAPKFFGYDMFGDMSPGASLKNTFGGKDNKGVAGLKAELRLLEQQLQNVGKARWKSFDKPLEGFGATLKKGEIETRISVLKEQIVAMGGSLEELSDDTNENASVWELLNREWEKAERNAKNLNDAVNQTGGKQGGGDTPVNTQRLTSQLGMVDPFYKPPTEELSEYQKYLESNIDLQERFAGGMAKIQGQAINMGGAIVGAATQMAESLGYAFGVMITGGDASTAMFQGIINTLSGFMRTLGEAMIAIGAAALVVMTQLFQNPGLAIAAGIGLIALAGMLQGMLQAPELAEGGIVSGPTLAMVGEYPGASANPEVIAPLNKLNDMMGGGNVNVTGQFRVRGTDLYLALEKYNKRRDSYS